jgi:hypothetical protein
MLDNYQFQQLTASGECFIHTHPHDALDNTSANELQNATRSRVLTGWDEEPSVTLTYADHFVEVTQSGTVYLPPATNGKEFHITLISTGCLVLIVPDGTDTILGTISATITTQWTSLHLKANETGNWYLA